MMRFLRFLCSIRVVRFPNSDKFIPILILWFIDFDHQLAFGIQVFHILEVQLTIIIKRFHFVVRISLWLRCVLQKFLYWIKGVIVTQIFFNLFLWWFLRISTLLHLKFYFGVIFEVVKLHVVCFQLFSATKKVIITIIKPFIANFANSSLKSQFAVTCYVEALIGLTGFSECHCGLNSILVPTQFVFDSVVNLQVVLQLTFWRVKVECSTAFFTEACTPQHYICNLTEKPHQLKYLQCVG